MQSVLRAVGVGVDLGSSATTVSTRRSDDRPEIRQIHRRATTPPTDRDRTETIDAATAATRTVRHDSPEGLAPVALAVPATWNSTRRRAHAEAAANAGFERVFLIPEPEAAARFFSEVLGHELEPGTPLVVYSLGAGSCAVGIVRREGDQYSVEAAKSADGIGGWEFDGFLLAYLSGRHRDTDPEFWQRAEDPAETALRTSLLDDVRRAREHLTDHPTVVFSPPGTERELRLTREDAEQCLAPAILQTVSLIEDVMEEADVGADRIAGLLMVGGASRTPLVASIIRHRIGIEPILPEMPELVIAEGAALAALAREQGNAAVKPSEEIPSRFRLRASLGALAVALVLVVAVAAAIGVALPNGDDPGPGDLGAAITDGPGLPSMPEETSASPEETGSGEPEGHATSDPLPSDSPSSEAQAEDHDDHPASQGPPPSSSAVDTEEPGDVSSDDEEEEGSASVGTVPDVVGASRSEARQILAEAGFTNVVTQSERRDKEGPDYEDCEVTAQNPDGGTRRAYGQRITVTYVYIGTDTC